MNLLAFDTSTEHLSIALSWPGQGAGGPASHRGAGGAQASASLIPAIESLLVAAGLKVRELDAIVFGRGPGSFTGLRTACSVAQGLAFGSGVPLLPVDTLLAVAEDARDKAGATRVVAVLDARMDEVYSARYELDAGRWHRRTEPALWRPESLAVPAGWTLAGNAAAAYAGRLPDGIEALPDALALLRVAPALLADGHATDAAGAIPLYVRDKVAQTTEERARSRAAADRP
ncbi:tRNA (adenosine(37)-N6)-threonylcarbamoyltransferase complex dimerization subunit type 1 TsaB [Ramlibacter sp.]|uniref:tRNA (adenosine(37)-N6)-threonylcarbamoyltransferase complex dimerization subunit type 1 TsaB n=1 Tax=Ramlibacter sp. TaxID=1917967 RepID=UPI003D0F24B9